MPSAVESLDEDLKILKEYASDIVADLARNESSLMWKSTRWDG